MGKRVIGSRPSFRRGMTITPEMVVNDIVTQRGVRKMPVTTEIEKSRHSSLVMSAKQEQRIRSGKIESSPADYQQPSDEQRRLGEARRKLEDMRIARELEID